MSEVLTHLEADPARRPGSVRKMYYGGEWHDAIGGGHFDDFEPYAGSVFARVPAGGPQDAAAAIKAAADAFPAWSGTTPTERARPLLDAAAIVKRRRTEIAELLARKTGSTLPFSTFQHGPQSIADFSDVIWINSHSGQREYPF